MWQGRGGDGEMGTLNLVTAGMGMWGWGAWVEQNGKMGTLSLAGQGQSQAISTQERDQEGISWWPEE